MYVEWSVSVDLLWEEGSGGLGSFNSQNSFQMQFWIELQTVAGRILMLQLWDVKTIV